MGLLQLQGEEMTYEQTKTVCRRVYSACIAKVEIADERTKKDPAILAAIPECFKLLERAGKDYRSSFENHNTMDDAENKYHELLSQIVDQLWIIAINAKLIENITVTQDEV